MGPPIVIRQYATESVVMTAEEARSISRAAGDTLRLQPDPHDVHRWTVSAGSKIGSLLVNGRSILIQPKIPPQNVFALLGAGIDDVSWGRDNINLEASPDLLVATVTWFARQVEQALGRGLLHSYQQHEESLVALRGRIHMPGLFRQGGMPLPAPCVFDEHTSDITENRYLKAAVQRALRVPMVDISSRRLLQQQAVRLAGVSGAGIQADGIDRLIYTRLNEHYRPALEMARLLLEDLTLTDQFGDVAASSFLIDMNLLFERFVTDRLRRSLLGRYEVIPQFSTTLDIDRSIRIQPDLVFRQQGKIRYVADVKYKLADDGLGMNADYYQLLAYCKALGLREGLLIYCREPSDRRERSVTIRNDGTQIRVLGIDLSGGPSEIEREMDHVVGAIQTLKSETFQGRGSCSSFDYGQIQP